MSMIDVENVSAEFDIDVWAKKIHQYTVDLFMDDLRKFLVFTVIYSAVGVGMAKFANVWMSELSSPWSLVSLVCFIGAIICCFPFWCYTITDVCPTYFIIWGRFIRKYDNVDAKSYVLEGIENGCAWTVVPGLRFVKLLLEGEEILSIRLSETDMLHITTADGKDSMCVHVQDNRRLSKPVTLYITDREFYIGCDKDKENVGIKPTITYRDDRVLCGSVEC